VQASAYFRVALVFAGLMVTAVMGIVMYAAFAVIEQHTTQWANRKMEMEV
jgi:NitT/TauT family transport system permease protein